MPSASGCKELRVSMSRKIAVSTLMAFALLAAQSAIAQRNTPAPFIFESNGVGPDSLGPVRILIDDQAKGGCWTNLGEVENYAADKLKQRGYEIDEDIGNFTLVIKVLRAEAAAIGND